MTRYVIETTNKLVKKQIQDWQVNDPVKKIKPKISLISEYDKEKFSERMLKIQQALATLSENKINEDILVAYLRSKNIPVSMAKALIRYEKEFFQKLGVM